MDALRRYLIRSQLFKLFEKKKKLVPDTTVRNFKLALIYMIAASVLIGNSTIVSYVKNSVSTLGICSVVSSRTLQNKKYLTNLIFKYIVIILYPYF